MAVREHPVLYGDNALRKTGPTHGKAPGERPCADGGDAVRDRQGRKRHAVGEGLLPNAHEPRGKKGVRQHDASVERTGPYEHERGGHLHRRERLASRKGLLGDVHHPFRYANGLHRGAGERLLTYGQHVYRAFLRKHRRRHVDDIRIRRRLCHSSPVFVYRELQNSVRHGL